ncbi:hypothetical protein P152DRAFT_458045 [Eremomyces bilateralis CBS 781.70]|uniref:BTB domain-containing protein n=1 Tax=Eremomyces bilateralis CBS 781.70 TaxID=1392243 RepID=A0A6G1G4I6_9PEZI|nr:uncharacterized protein P152DRAFT_458045 [Eremomyces bilateralis CBS 781.70]KAF1812861.1 hypothetical protein P152DRAFT_458045 [Eremomyces bilateralis CBS 781.70]
MAVNKTRPTSRIVPAIPLVFEKRPHTTRNSISGLSTASSAELPTSEGPRADDKRAEVGEVTKQRKDPPTEAQGESDASAVKEEALAPQLESSPSHSPERRDSGIASRQTSSPAARDISTTTQDQQAMPHSGIPVTNGDIEAPGAVNGNHGLSNGTSVLPPPEIQPPHQAPMQHDLPLRRFQPGGPLVFGGRPESPLDPSSLPPPRFTNNHVFAPAFVPSSAHAHPVSAIPSATPNGTVLTPTSVPFIPNNALNSPTEQDAFAGAPRGGGAVASPAHSRNGTRTMSPQDGGFAVPPMQPSPAENYTDLSLLYQDQDKHRWSNGSSKDAIAYPDPALNQLVAGPGEYSDMEHMSLMRTSILNMFGTDVLADYILILHDSRLDRLFMTFPVHSIIISQSPTLSRLLLSPSQSFNPYERMKALHATLHDPFVTPHAFTDALRYVYGARPLTLDDLSRTWDPYGNLLEHTDTPEVFSRCLAYFAAGYILQLPSLCHHGLHYARSLIGPDTLAMAFDFAYARKDPTQGSGHGGFAYGMYNKDFLLAINDYLIAHLPADLTFDAHAPELTGNMERFPYHHLHHARSRSRSVRPGIQFGQVSVSPDGIVPAPSPTALFSSVLLTIPFRTLRQVFEAPAFAKRVGSERARGLAEVVVAEREKRRVVAMGLVGVVDRESGNGIGGGSGKGGQKKNGQGGKGSPSDTVRLSERVEVRDGGFILTRRE